MKKLYVGNLSYSSTEESLREFFAAFGPIVSVRIITDSYSGQSRGFAFVELEDDAMADDAIAQLNGKSLDGKQLKINEARPQTDRGGSGGGGRSFRGGNGGGARSSGGGGNGGGYGDRRRAW